MWRDPGQDGGAEWEIIQVARFYGTYEHSLDSKGRVILPAKFRSFFEDGGYLTQYLDGCLALLTPEEFDREMAKVAEKAAQSRKDRNLARLRSARTHPVEIDGQGRMALPPRLREYAALSGDVIVVGNYDRVELWNPERFQETVGPEEQRLLEGDDA